MEQQLKSSAINYGIYLGIGLSLITVLIYIFSLDTFVNLWYYLILTLVVIIVGIVSTAKSKSINGGFLSFKEAFSSYFIPVAIGMLISVAINILIFSVIDTKAADYVQDKSIESAVAMMEKWGAPSSEIDKVLEEADNNNSLSAVNQLKQSAKSLLFFAVVGLIVAAIMKKRIPI
jgi:predicted DNA repair protein MutK